MDSGPRLGRKISKNALSPINVTLVRLLHSANALPSIEVTLEGMVMLVRLLHQTNAQYPIAVTPSGIIILPLADG